MKSKRLSPRVKEECLPNQAQQLLHVVACTAGHPSKLIINNENYLLKDPKILSFPREHAFPRLGHKPFTLCTNRGNLLLCAKPPSIPKSFCIHLCVCLHKGTSCIIKMQTPPGWRRDSNQSADAPLLWGKGYVLVRT